MFKLIKKIKNKIKSKNKNKEIPQNENEKFWMPFKDVTYNTDGLATVVNCDFIEDPLFKQSYELGEKTGSWGDRDPIWRCYICCCAARHALNFEGDFVECGVNKGGLSRALVNYVDFGQLKDRKLWLYDTYNGMDLSICTDTEKDVAELYNNMMYSECYDEVVETFKEFDNVEIVKGNILETLDKFTGNKIAYLSIDMNCLAPEIAAIEYFWDKLSKGCMVILDDYGWKGHEEQKIGFDNFVKKVGAQIISLPIGQGLLIKP